MKRAGQGLMPVLAAAAMTAGGGAGVPPVWASGGQPAGVSGTGR